MSKSEPQPEDSDKDLMHPSVYFFISSVKELRLLQKSNTKMPSCLARIKHIESVVDKELESGKVAELIKKYDNYLPF